MYFKYKKFFHLTCPVKLCHCNISSSHFCCGVVRGWVVYYVLGQCTVRYGGVLCRRAVYYVIGQCIVCKGSVLCVEGGVLRGRVVYCACTVRVSIMCGMMVFLRGRAV